MAKWLAAGLEILIVDERSIRIDIKTKGYPHQLLSELSDRDTAILLITSDMSEMVTLADRIAVMNAFRVAGEFHNARDSRKISADIMNLIHQVEAA